jgi:hypothetical protein
MVGKVFLWDKDVGCMGWKWYSYADSFLLKGFSCI